MKAKFVSESVHFTRGGDNPISNLGIGKYRDLQKYRELYIKELILLLRKLGYIKEEEGHNPHYDPSDYETHDYSYMGMPIKSGILFWIDLKSPIQFYKDHKDFYFESQNNFSASLTAQEFKPNKHTEEFGGIYQIDLNIRKNGEFMDLPDAYDSKGIATIPELLDWTTNTLKKAEIYVKKHLNKEFRSF